MHDIPPLPRPVCIHPLFAHFRSLCPLSPQKMSAPERTITTWGKHTTSFSMFFRDVNGKVNVWVDGKAYMWKSIPPSGTPAMSSDSIVFGGSNVGGDVCLSPAGLVPPWPILAQTGPTGRAGGRVQEFTAARRAVEVAERFCFIRVS